MRGGDADADRALPIDRRTVFGDWAGGGADGLQAAASGNARRVAGIRMRRGGGTEFRRVRPSVTLEVDGTVERENTESRISRRKHAGDPAL
eukprot:ctg_2109.g546